MRSDFNVERAWRMETLYKTGKTLAEIGGEYGLTRERVRQILKSFGVSPDSGGVAKRAMDKASEKIVATDKRYLKRWGCTKTQWDYLRGFDKRRENTPIGRFSEQRRNAKQRGIEWDLTLWEWWTIWEESGRWDKRGRNDGEYVMARLGDTGPYEAGNVSIKTCNNNCAEARAKQYCSGIEGIFIMPASYTMARSAERAVIDKEEKR